MDNSVDAALLARGTPGFSGAELCNLVNEAALLAARRDVDAISAKLLDEACDKILMGVERKCVGHLCAAWLVVCHWLARSESGLIQLCWACAMPCGLSILLHRFAVAAVRLPELVAQLGLPMEAATLSM